MTYWYIHREAQPSALIRDASTCRRWKLTQKHTTGQCADSGRLWVCNLKIWNLLLKFLCGRGRRKTIRTEGDGWIQGSSIFGAHKGWCKYKLKETVTAYIISGEVLWEIRQNSSRRSIQHSISIQDTICYWHLLKKWRTILYYVILSI